MIVTVMMEELVEIATYDVEQIQVYLEKATEHPNGRLWVDCFITPVFIAHLYLRTERNELVKWRLVIAPVLSEEDVMLFVMLSEQQQLIGTMQDILHGICQDMQSLANWMLKNLKRMLCFMLSELSGEHVCRHQEGTWNSVFSDQFGEQTYIRYGKAK